MGGSSASAILGCNPYMSKLELYKAIVYPAYKKIERENESMTFGTKLEPLIRREFAEDHKEQYLVHTPKNWEMYRRLDKPYMTATLDGILTEKKTKRKGVLEIKTHDIRNRADESNWAEHMPQNYYVQVMHYLMVMNDFEFVDLVARLRFFDYYNEDGKKLLKVEYRYYHIERSEVADQIKNLEKAETLFWENNVLKKVIPQETIKF